MKKSILVVAGLFSAFLFNSVFGASVAIASGFDAVSGAVALNVVGVGLGIVQWATQAQTVSGIFTSGLVKEMWLAEVMQKWRPNPAWLSKARDLSAYVTNGVLNLAEAGVDPDVILDYDGSYEIPVMTGDDTPLALPLHRLSTKRDRILSGTQKTRMYSIMADRTTRHTKTLQEFALRYAGTAFSPSADSQYTPVIATTGANNASGFKSIKLADIVSLKAKLRALNADGELILILNSQHLAELQIEDMQLFKGFTPQQFTTEGFPLLGFTAYESNSTATYNKSTGARKAFGAAAAPSTDTISSFAFVSGEVGFADGALEMFTLLNNPAYQADEFNFAKQWTAVPMRSKGMAAVYSAAGA